ncbi:MAG: hypothetical protein J6Y60_02305 [Treponema sp.]|nr:hypothetical protein [Treponema sp.]
MFVTIIFDGDYYGMAGRDKWFLKALSDAHKNDSVVITHEYLDLHFKEIADKCLDRFYKEFEMEYITDSDYKTISKGFVPDSIFNKIRSKFISRTEELMYLFSKRDTDLERILIDLIEKQLLSRNEKKVDAIFNCLDCFASVKYLGDYFNCPVIPYSFSAIRKMHGYTETLYIADMIGEFSTSKGASLMYQSFKENAKDVSIFSNRELLAMFGKEKNIPILSVIERNGIHEFGICKTANSIYPFAFLKYKYTDTDLYYDVKDKLKTNDIILRDHLNIPWNGTDSGYKKEHQRNDPVSFITSCKRISSVDSQILLKALLWNRTVIANGDLVPFEFLCEHDIKSEKKVDSFGLNFFIFAYLIPSSLMFSKVYWLWRLNNPSVYEIYTYHLNYYINKFNFDVNKLKLQEEDRFFYILEKRGINQQIIEKLKKSYLQKNIDYDVLSSRIDFVFNDDKVESFYCLNEPKDGFIYSSQLINFDVAVKNIHFYPFVDVCGVAYIENLIVDGDIIFSQFKEANLSKQDGYINFTLDLCPGKHLIEFKWKYKFNC